MARKKFTRQEQSRRVSEILRALDESYPDARCALEHRNAHELLIATILSAQCTDERVNQVTRELFRKHPSPADFVRVPGKVLEQEIRPTGFYRNKAKNVQGACQMILEKFEGRVPDTMEELIQLPGVARKTANVVLGVIFGKAEGIVVDTHVFRIARRLDLSKANSPEQVERELMALIPRSNWINFSHQVIHHGRRICKARKPLCHLCPVEKVCESKDKVLTLPTATGSGSRRRKGAALAAAKTKLATS
jgi:endonuclease-3